MQNDVHLLRGLIIHISGDDRLAKHEFGIIDFWEENKWYSTYEPEKYNCIAVSDDLIAELMEKYNEELMTIKT